MGGSAVLGWCGNRPRSGRLNAQRSPDLAQRHCGVRQVMQSNTKCGVGLVGFHRDIGDLMRMLNGSLRTSSIISKPQPLPAGLGGGHACWAQGAVQRGHLCHNQLL
jgi:hypothetical protein